MFKSLKLFGLAAAAAMALTSVASANPWGIDLSSGWGNSQSSSASADAFGGSSGGVVAGMGSAVATSGSVAITRADTNPNYAGAIALNGEMIAVGAVSPTLSEGNFVQDSRSQTQAFGGQGTEGSNATADGGGAFRAGAAGDNSFTAGGTIGTAGTGSVSVERRGQSNDRSLAGAQQTTMSGAISGASGSGSISANSAASARSAAAAGAPASLQ